MRWIALGLVLAWLDLRLGRADVLPDPLGWLAVAYGLGGLVRDDPRLRVLQYGALVVGLLSLSTVVLPEELASVAVVTGGQGALIGLASLLGTLVVAGTAEALARRAGRREALRQAVSWRLLAVLWLVVALAEAVVLGLVVLMWLTPTGTAVVGGLDGIVLFTALGGLAVALMTVVLLLRHASLSWAPRRPPRHDPPARTAG